MPMFIFNILFINLLMITYSEPGVSLPTEERNADKEDKAPDSGTVWSVCVSFLGDTDPPEVFALVAQPLTHS